MSVAGIWVKQMDVRTSVEGEARRNLGLLAEIADSFDYILA